MRRWLAAISGTSKIISGKNKFDFLSFFLFRSITLELHLSLKTFSIFMVTYLPTILMNIINQATNYISGEDRYQTIFDVNITSMMVLASIYLTVSNSLPGSSNIKPVEIWLLFNLAFPFLVIIVNILLQVLYLQGILKGGTSGYHLWQYFSSIMKNPQPQEQKSSGKKKERKKNYKVMLRMFRFRF